MSRDSFAMLALFFVFFFVMGAAVGCAIGDAVQTTMGREAAIEAGVAEYTIDPKTGETSFVYKTCK